MFNANEMDFLDSLYIYLFSDKNENEKRKANYIPQLLGKFVQQFSYFKNMYDNHL